MDSEQGSPGLLATEQEVVQSPVRLTEFLFDTVIEITAYCDQELLEAARERLTYFEQIFSRTREGSDIWTLNTAAGATVEVHPETAEVIAQALPFCELSDGLFDITIGTITSLWDFNDAVVPDPGELARALLHIDYRKVLVEGNTVTLADPEAKLDLGAIAKGYIADDIAALLRAGGCASANINLGGNVYVLGNKPDGSPWNVGIQDPLQGRGTVMGRVSVSDTSVVTSGPYERSFELDGVFYHHILDPRTGYPAQTDLASVSIISDSSAEGDALTTTTFLLGKAAALALVEARPSAQAVFVDNNGSVVTTNDAGFEQF
ncbi:MAG: FAD:protein FMN transferase [Coriobacteriales bacterium]|nr:FAD:protein FMN transferase [Coriobacteriales bacterium]